MSEISDKRPKEPSKEELRAGIEMRLIDLKGQKMQLAGQIQQIRAKMMMVDYVCRQPND
jgi:hypothetical protein